MNNYKPQSPLVVNGNGIFPLTTYDQIIMSDGSRWDGKSSGVGVPIPTVEDANKILRVNAEGKFELALLSYAEEASF